MLAFQADGKFVLRDTSADAIIWKALSKDKPGPHWAEFKNGKRSTFRSETGDRRVMLWSSKELKDDSKRSLRFGITRDKKAVVFRDEGVQVDIVWRSGGSIAVKT